MRWVSVSGVSALLWQGQCAREHGGSVSLDQNARRVLGQVQRQVAAASTRLEGLQLAQVELARPVGAEHRVCRSCNVTRVSGVARWCHPQRHRRQQQQQQRRARGEVPRTGDRILGNADPRRKVSRGEVRVGVAQQRGVLVGIEVARVDRGDDAAYDALGAVVDAGERLVVEANVGERRGVGELDQQLARRGRVGQTGDRGVRNREGGRDARRQR